MFPPKEWPPLSYHPSKLLIEGGSEPRLRAWSNLDRENGDTPVAVATTSNGALVLLLAHSTREGRRFLFRGSSLKRPSHDAC